MLPALRSLLSSSRTSVNVSKMPTPKIDKRFFSRVRIARELLRDRAEDLLEQYLIVIKDAQEKGEHEAALKAIQWLMEHMPAEEDGTKLLDTSIDKNIQPIVQDTRPAIQIGIQLGGVGVAQPKAIEAPKAKKPKAIKGEVINA